MAYAQLIDAVERHLLPCGVKQLTGMDCPGCGLQTALVALLRGDLAASVVAHPALLPLLALIVFAAVHLKAGFRNGPRVVLALFLLSAALMIVNYIGRLGLLR